MIRSLIYDLLGIAPQHVYMVHEMHHSGRIKTTAVYRCEKRAQAHARRLRRPHGHVKMTWVRRRVVR